MDEQIKPVAWIMPSALKALHRSEVAMVGPVNQGADEPLYSQQSIDALRAEVEGLQWQLYGEINGKQLVEAEAEALRADAERYRWLCDGNGYFMEECYLCGHENEKARADAAIDAARKGAE